MKIIDKYKKSKIPKMVKINFDNIPNELKELNCWVNWYWKWGGKKWTKPPCDPNGYDINHLQSKNSFKECEKAAKEDKNLGIGFSLRKEDEFCGIDFDDCLNKKGKPNKRLKHALKLLSGTYSEVSPSGSGVRTFGLGKPTTRGSSKHSREIEIYNSGRYLTITGQKLKESSSKLSKISKAIKKIDKKIYKRKDRESYTSDGTNLERHELTNPKLKKIRDYLFKIDPENRDTWIHCGMIIHFETNGSPEGYQLWNGWSKTTTAGNYSEDELFTSWNSFKKKSKKEKPLTMGTLKHYVKNKKEEKKKEKIESELPVLSNYNSVAKANIKDVENIMSPWFMKGSVNMVHAKRGLGKTHFCLAVALSLATGGSFLKWKAKKPLKVLYADGEMPFALLKDFLNVQIKATGLNPDKNNLSFVTIDKQKDGYFPSLSTEEGRDWFEKAINDYEPDVVIFDSLFTCFKINEYSGDYWSGIQEWLIRLRTNGIDILLVHHDNKSGNAQSGRVDKEHILNTIIHLKEPSGLQKGKSARFEIIFNKARHFWGNDAKSFEARLKPLKNEYSQWEVKKSESTTKDTIVEYFKQGMTGVDIAEILNINKGTVSRYKKILLEEGLLKETDIRKARIYARKKAKK